MKARKVERAVGPDTRAAQVTCEIVRPRPLPPAYRDAAERAIRDAMLAGLDGVIDRSGASS